MSDEQLAEIERVAGGWSDYDPVWVIGDGRMMTSDILLSLVAEVRRLKRALHLSEISRGAPSVVGGD